MLLLSWTFLQYFLTDLNRTDNHPSITLISQANQLTKQASHSKSPVKINFSKSTLTLSIGCNLFLANAPILYPLKTPENRFQGGIKWEHWPEIG